MLALYLVAAHMVGDYLLQTRWQALGKFGWTRDAVRTRATHCTAYTLAFVPVVWSTLQDWPSVQGGVAFLAYLWALHFFTDAQRFTRTPGELLASLRDQARGREVEPLGPNPWAPMPILIDQSLHLVQVAVLAAVFLA